MTCLPHPLKRVIIPINLLHIVHSQLNKKPFVPNKYIRARKAKENHAMYRMTWFSEKPRGSIYIINLYNKWNLLKICPPTCGAGILVVPIAPVHQGLCPTSGTDPLLHPGQVKDPTEMRMMTKEILRLHPFFVLAVVDPPIGTVHDD